MDVDSVHLLRQLADRPELNAAPTATAALENNFEAYRHTMPNEIPDVQVANPAITRCCQTMAAGLNTKKRGAMLKSPCAGPHEAK